MAAIYFNPEGFSLSGPRLMGRQAAGHSFLRGFFRHSSAATHYAYTTNDDHQQAFAAFAKSEKSEKPVISVTPRNLDDLGKPGCLFLPGPGLDEFARKRSLINSQAFSLCGITHTTLSGRAMDAITSLLSTPVQPWDALICTSHSVRDTIDTVLKAEADYLKHRLGATRFVLPKLPVIPLGIMAQDFEFTESDRLKARAFFKFEPDEIAILFVGRLSFHAKAHPAAMYQALSSIGKKRKLALIECGWFANQAIQHAFDEAAQALAPNIRRIVVDGRQANLRSCAWHAADIFMSLTDNLQETFGITPIEAMASGLPVIVSDWDGYRDTVRHGIDGFRIPTYMPKSGLAPNCAFPYALDIINYDQYCGKTSHLVSVDLEETRAALNALVENPGLRYSMGKNGRARAKSAFDWSEIIRKYEDLWYELNEERSASTNALAQPTHQNAWPARTDPLKSFASYPTELIDCDTGVCIASDEACAIMKHQIKLSVFTLSKSLIDDISKIDRVIAKLEMHSSKSPRRISDDVAMPIDEIIPIIMFGLKVGALKTDTPMRQMNNVSATGRDR